MRFYFPSFVFLFFHGNSMAQAPVAAAPAAGAAPNPTPAQAPAAGGASAIVYSTQLRLFVFDRAKNAYAAAGGGGLCGCVVVGSGTNYSLLIYDAQKQHLCTTPLGGDFKLTVQANNYVSFTTANSGEAMSVNLASEEQLKGFCKHVLVTCAHVARHSGGGLQSESVLQVRCERGSRSWALPSYVLYASNRDRGFRCLFFSLLGGDLEQVCLLNSL